MLEIKIKLSQLRTYFHNQLSHLYEEREIETLFFIYIEDKYNIKKHSYFIAPNHCVDFEKKDLELLSKGTPIQYVTGKTTFFELPFLVNPSVLIPRPETEELVETIVNQQKEESRRQKAEGRKQKGISITLFSKSTLSSRKQKAKSRRQKLLDIGTGSGIIAISLKKNITNAEVWASDISEKALETAKKNAENNKVNINFLHHNILKDDNKLLPDNLDIIVSNPPYIPLRERSNLHTNVVHYEPQEALFVPDENPLIFYKAIAQTAKKLLKKGGVLYFETYEKFHDDLSAMLKKLGFKEVLLWNDINDKPRFVSCKKL